MREFKYKGEIVRLYEPFYYNKSEKFFKLSIGVCYGASGVLEKNRRYAESN